MIKWAVANGNWSAGATWNDGVVPVAGDTVYLNGKTVSANVDINILSNNDGLITNEPNSDYSIINGGELRINTNRTIRANLTAGSENLINANSFTGTINLIANTIIGGTTDTYQKGYILWHKCNTLNVMANNIIGRDSVVFNGENQICSCTINGNINKQSGQNFFSYYSTNQFSVVINGNVDLGTGLSGSPMSNITINGNLTVRTTRLLSAITTIINGNISYSVNPLQMFRGVTGTLNLPYNAQYTYIGGEPTPNVVLISKGNIDNRQQYPSENVVKQGVEYVWGQKVGTYQQPPEAVVLKDYVYDNGDKIGSLENQNIVGCVTPEDVRKDVPLVGMGVVGTLVVPDVDDVREGVVFDNGSVGTLIVEGGGDRLRIADFGYYTNSQSDTYIVDINESFKPMFATAEESVLLELFPELDLNDIPDKYFDDLFVKYLKYRLIVEYYRGAGINSVFTPSELTTEVVNYQNVRCEYWLNLANIYLNAWDKKYPNSVKKQRILL